MPNPGANSPVMLNPIRYRSYYYDSDIGFYYLGSRYYDPAICRFINADGQINQQDGMLGVNLFAYCINNPVNGSDPCGTCLHHWKFWKDCNKCATSKANKRALEAAQTIKYDVPLYRQGSLSLCWAFCQTMIESYNSGQTLSQKKAKKRAIEIAQDYHGSKKNWNKGGFPSNAAETGFSVSNIEELYDILKDNGPVYACYFNDNYTKGHGVVVTGVNLYSKKVYTNNPWGNRGVQSFEEFNSGFATKWYHFKSGKRTSGAIIYLVE